MRNFLSLFFLLTILFFKLSALESLSLSNEFLQLVSEYQSDSQKTEVLRENFQYQGVPLNLEVENQGSGNLAIIIFDLNDPL